MVRSNGTMVRSNGTSVLNGLLPFRARTIRHIHLLSSVRTKLNYVRTELLRSERTASVQRENNLTNLYSPHSVRTEHTSVRTERRVSAAVFQSIRVPFERNLGPFERNTVKISNSERLLLPSIKEQPPILLCNEFY